MLIVSVLIEHGTYTLNRPFSYVYMGARTLNKGVRVVVPFNNQSVVGYVINVESSPLSKEEYIAEKNYEIKEISAIIDETPLISDELFHTAQEIADHYFTPLIKVLKTMLPPSLKPTTGSLKKAHIAYEKILWAKACDESSLTPKQAEIYRLIASSKTILKRNVKSPSALKILIEKGFVEESEREKQRYIYEADDFGKEITLNEEQKAAVKSFLTSSKPIHLLEGVTGSGKTEVYLELVKEALNRKQKAILLVPEIALTPLMMQRFYHTFPNQVAILHSELTNGEKYDEYRKIKRGDVDIVIGTRSAIFAPLDKLGLIIMDEEHVDSYKQENQPCYHAREVAIMRIKHFPGAKLLLGSATPTLESRARALKNVYHLIELKKRANETPLPHCHIINMQDHQNIDYKSSLFSLPLRFKIEQCLTDKEQVVLLLNRRGYATSMICRECGTIIKCPDCDIPLTYHAKDQLLKCHHCDHVEFVPSMCPECHSHHLSKIGFGIEKVIEEAQNLFPSARIMRLDSDVGQVKDNIAGTLNKFRQHEADILIGTQMIAKGHDFPDVTLVGVILADQGLSLPNYRASETTFELLTQAIGRAGRGKKTGEAVIQTYMPNHYAITLAAAQNYEAFFLEEMRVRKMQQYPPYTYVSTLTIIAKDIDTVEEAAGQIVVNLRDALPMNVAIIGPSIPYINSTRQGIRRSIILKYKRFEEIQPAVSQLIEVFAKRSTITIVVDVDSL